MMNLDKMIDNFVWFFKRDEKQTIIYDRAQDVIDLITWITTVWTDQYLDIYERNTTVYSSVNLIAKSLIKLDYWVYKNWKLNENDKNLSLLNNNLIFWIVVNYLIFWESYIYKNTIWNKVVSLDILNPWKVYFVWESWTNNKNTEFFEYKDWWKIYKKEMKNLIIINNYSYKNKNRWVWWLDACINQVLLIEKIDSWNTQNLITGWRVWWVFKIPKKLSKEERDALKIAFWNSHAWSANVWRNVILWEGEDYTDLVNKVMEMDFNWLKTWALEEILSSFWVNKWLLWKENNLNYATLQVYVNMFIDNVIEPLCIFIQDWFNKAQLFDWEFNFINIKSEKLDEIIKWYTNWIYTLNESRAKAWLFSVKDWDFLITLWQKETISEQKLKDELKQKEIKVKSEIWQVYDSFLKDLQKDLNKDIFWTEEYFENQVNTIDNLSKKDDEIITEWFNSIFNKQIKEINTILEKSSKKDYEKKVNKYFEDNSDKNTTLFKTLFYSYLALYFKNWINSVYKEFKDLKISWYIEVWDKEITNELNKQIKKLSKTLDETTAKSIIGILSTEQEKWYWIKEIAKTISDKMTDLNRNRIELITKTELLEAANNAKLSVYSANSDIVSWKKWYTTLDERVCSNCWPLHWKVIELDKNYYSMWEKTDAWLNIEYRDIIAPPLHPRCRCIITPVLSE